LRYLLLAGVLGIAALAAYVVHLDITIREQFEGKRWALPARVYASPLELYPGLKLSPAQLAEELTALDYRYGPSTETGHYLRGDSWVEVGVRPFVFWDGPQPAVRLRVTFAGGRVQALENAATGEPLPLARLDPLPIGGIYPAQNEDRVLVKLEQVPEALVDALIAMEDRNFYRHHGIDPRGIARALLANLRAGDAVQGGSTLTQQLVKNFYLSAERTLRRKAVEAIMAVLLDAHYEKDEILEAYVNEIYLGQDGNRAIHGFGLAAQFYFERPLERLSLPEAALLVALVKGPSYYDPRRHPQRALERRNLVHAELLEQNEITSAAYLRAKSAPLGVAPRAPIGTTPYPAFLSLVHRQLRRDYSDTDLRSEGLRIFTTLDPRVQRAAEAALSARLAALERQRRLPENGLEGAVIVTASDSGEVLALVGGRQPRYEGFNRALDARRQIGSLIKPALYLTALSRPEDYTLVTRLDDGPLSWSEPGVEWTPQNYDKQFHGEVPLAEALAKSYNVAAARLGLHLGLPAVIETASRLGIERPLPEYGSTLLGTVALSPFEVAQMYQTLASGGFRTPLRAIREVLTPEGVPLKRYPLSLSQVVDPAAAFLTTTALQQAVREGTGSSLRAWLPPELNVAGKTGTTDDLRDSWFAGFTGDKLAVVWVGRDDNKPTGLTGASGALTVWGRLMASLDPAPLDPPVPESIEFVRIDPQTGLRAGSGCDNAVEVPFARGSAPSEQAPCSREAPVKSWFRRLFE